MEGTYRHVLEATDELDVASAAVASSGNGLACITSILVFLLNLTATASLAGKISMIVEQKLLHMSSNVTTEKTYCPISDTHRGKIKQIT